MPPRLRSLHFMRSLPCVTLHKPFSQVQTHFNQPALSSLLCCHCPERLQQIAEILRAVLGISNSGTIIQRQFGWACCKAVWAYRDIPQAFNYDGRNVKPFREGVSQRNPRPPSLGQTAIMSMAGLRGLLCPVTQRPATRVVRYMSRQHVICKWGKDFS